MVEFHRRFQLVKGVTASKKSENSHHQCLSVYQLAGKRPSSEVDQQLSTSDFLEWQYSTLFFSDKKSIFKKYTWVKQTLEKWEPNHQVSWLVPFTGSWSNSMSHSLLLCRNESDPIQGLLHEPSWNALWFSRMSGPHIITPQEMCQLVFFAVVLERETVYT